MSQVFWKHRIIWGVWPWEVDQKNPWKLQKERRQTFQQPFYYACETKDPDDDEAASVESLFVKLYEQEQSLSDMMQKVTELAEASDKKVALLAEALKLPEGPLSQLRK